MKPLEKKLDRFKSMRDEAIAKNQTHRVEKLTEKIEEIELQLINIENTILAADSVINPV